VFSLLRRLEKEHVQRLAGLAAQKAKALQSHERDRDGLLVRRDDLNVQLDEMQRKYRVSVKIEAFLCVDLFVCNHMRSISCFAGEND